MRAAFPRAALIVRELRDTHCGDPGCGWCAGRNDPVGALKRWFGFEGYRPQPVDATGQPLQQVIVARTMAHAHVLTLGKGLTVFRSAMTIHLNPGRAGFTRKDFLPLEEHYREQTLQTHVMAAYAETGLDRIAEAVRLSEDYFALDQTRFL